MLAGSNEKNFSFANHRSQKNKWIDKNKTGHLLIQQ